MKTLCKDGREDVRAMIRSRESLWMKLRRWWCGYRTRRKPPVFAARAAAVSLLALTLAAFNRKRRFK